MTDMALVGLERRRDPHLLNIDFPARLDARRLFDPSAPRRPLEAPAGATGLAGLLRHFYSERLARRGLVVTSALLTYAGGAAMFWLHAIHEGEQGPPINNWAHWLLDSTIGFLALTPVLLFLIPAGVWAMSRRGGSAGPGGSAGSDGSITGRRLLAYGAVVGCAFALFTGPGPKVHDTIAGAGTPLARAATSVFGYDPAVAAKGLHSPEPSPVREAVLQIAFGLPVYSGLTLLAVGAVRASRRLGASGRRGQSAPVTPLPRRVAAAETTADERLCS